MAIAEIIGARAIREAVPALITILQREPHHGHVMYRVIQVLGQLRDTRAIDPLFAILADIGYLEPDPYHEELAAIYAVLRDKTTPVSDTLFDRYAEIALHQHRIDLERVYVERPHAIAYALGQIGDPRAADALMTVLRYGYMKAEAMNALGYVGDQRAIPLLSLYLADESDVSRWGGGPIKNTARWAIDEITRRTSENLFITPGQ